MTAAAEVARRFAKLVVDVKDIFENVSTIELLYWRPEPTI